MSTSCALVFQKKQRTQKCHSSHISAEPEIYWIYIKVIHHRHLRILGETVALRTKSQLALTLLKNYHRIVCKRWKRYRNIGHIKIKIAEVGIQKVLWLKNSTFLPLYPFVHPCLFYIYPLPSMNVCFSYCPLPSLKQDSTTLNFWMNNQELNMLNIKD